jgi:hypothetical protein
MQLAPPRARLAIERRGYRGVDTAADRSEASLTGRVRTKPRIERVQIGARRCHVEHHRQLHESQVFKQAPACVRAQIGANSGHVRAEHRRTPRGWWRTREGRSQGAALAPPIRIVIAAAIPAANSSAQGLFGGSYSCPALEWCQAVDLEIGPSTLFAGNWAYRLCRADRLVELHCHLPPAARRRLARGVTVLLSISCPRSFLIRSSPPP